jgi:predicted glycosyltransferase involved in capsule biosynthesis
MSSVLATAEALDGEAIIVNFGGDHARLLKQLPSSPRIKIAHIASEQYFHKARAQNIGAWFSKYELLFFCDCDIVLVPKIVTTIVRKVTDHPGTFATLAGVRESEQNARGAGNVICFGYELRIRIANGRELHIVDNEEDAEEGTRQAPGLLLVRKGDFLSVAGYNGRLHGWGWEDQDMIARLTLGLGLRRIVYGTVTHISHSESARVARYPIKNRWESRDRMFRQALANYDNSEFTGTYNEDVGNLAVLTS